MCSCQLVAEGGGEGTNAVPGFIQVHPYVHFACIKYRGSPPQAVTVRCCTSQRATFR